MEPVTTSPTGGRGRFAALALAGCLAAAAAAGCSGDRPPAADVHDPVGFARVVDPDARFVRLAGGLPYVEGPVWLPGEGALVFSAMKADELKRWRPGHGLDTYRSGSGRANGNALDREGRLVTCEHATRRVSRTRADGTVETLADRYEGRRLHSPNDVAVRADGTVWFTDPPYGLDREPPEARELDGNYIFRLDPGSGDLAVVADDFDRPNGIAFAPDDRTLYVSDSGAPRHLRAFDVAEDGSLANGRVLYALPADGSRGKPDGLAVARDGTLFLAVGDGVDVLGPDGRRLGTLRVAPEDAPARNVALGGADGRTLFVTAGAALCAVELRAPGR